MAHIEENLWQKAIPKTALSFQNGNRFTVKGDIDKTIYIFHKVEFEEGVSCIHCEDTDGNEIVLEETYLSDLEHV